MTQKSILLIALGIFICLVCIQVLIRSKHPVKKTIFNILIGIFSLIAVNISSTFTGVFIPVSLLSLGVAAVLGLPGVTMILMLNMIL